MNNETVNKEGKSKIGSKTNFITRIFNHFRARHCDTSLKYKLNENKHKRLTRRYSSLKYRSIIDIKTKGKRKALYDDDYDYIEHNSNILRYSHLNTSDEKLDRSHLNFLNDKLETIDNNIQSLLNIDYFGNNFDSEKLPYSFISNYQYLIEEFVNLSKLEKYCLEKDKFKESIIIPTKQKLEINFLYDKDKMNSELKLIREYLTTNYLSFVELFESVNEEFSKIKIVSLTTSLLDSLKNVSFE